MANRTVKDAHTVHGTNPQYLVEKIIRSRIYEAKYWKEHCFALTSELLVDKAVELRYVGGIFGNNVKPTPFICLTLKMLQIQPDKDIVIEFIKQEPYKYARALGAFYLRLIGESDEIYKYLETLYNDFRRLKFQDESGNFALIYMDDFIDQLLTEERVCDIILPRLQKRAVLEDAGLLDPRMSLLNEDLDALELENELEELEQPPVQKSLTSSSHHKPRRDQRPERRHRRDEDEDRHRRDEDEDRHRRDDVDKEEEERRRRRRLRDSDAPTSRGGRGDKRREDSPHTDDRHHRSSRRDRDRHRDRRSRSPHLTSDRKTEKRRHRDDDNRHSPDHRRNRNKDRGEVWDDNRR